jgi:NADPH:quinone reductase-like Zn-dependent oxidoreductase
VRAFAIDEFGKPGEVTELPVPTAGQGEVVIRVAAASVNPMDAVVAAGGAQQWAQHRFPLVPGLDAAGTVTAVGPGVAGISVGDEVMASASDKPYYGGGTFAEFVAIPVQAVAKKPISVDIKAASTLPLAGLTALAAIEAIEPQSGQTIAVIGATGAVGSFFVQFAAKRGATVVALARPANSDYARQLGATEVIDHTADPVAQIHKAHPDGIDAIADFTGNLTLVAATSLLLKQGGLIASSAAYGLDAALFATRGIEVGRVNALPNSRLSELARLIDGEGIRPPQIQERSLNDAAAALTAVGQRHNRGKVVLTIG